MKKLRILPGAAGIIALTASIGFIDGQRDFEAESFARGRIALVQVTADGAIPEQSTGFKLTHPAYLVEIRRGDTFAEVKVDAITGRVLLS